MKRALTPGALFGKLRLQRRLGSGGTAEVWEARRRNGELVALKLYAEASSSARVDDEAWVGTEVLHPNLRKVLERGREGEQDFLVLELLHGLSLSQLVERTSSRFPVGLVLALGAQALTGLAAAHQQLVVHRDVKPSNLFVGSDGVLRLLDFGTAHLASQERTQTVTGMVRGTPAYLSPEQARGERVDMRSDFFSLGVVLWELLTGKRAFRRDTDAATLTAILFEPLPPASAQRPEVPGALSSLVQWMTEKAPGARPPAALEVKRALESAGEPPWSAAQVAEWMAPFLPAEEAAAPGGRGLRRAAALWLLGVTVVVIGVLALVLALRPHPPAPRALAPRTSLASPVVLVPPHGDAPTLPAGPPPAAESPPPTSRAPRPERASKASKRSVSTARPGFLTIDARPTYGRVTVDGQQVGLTPVYRLSLAVGAHRLEVVRADGTRQARLATVKADEETQVVIQW